MGLLQHHSSWRSQVSACSNGPVLRQWAGRCQTGVSTLPAANSHSNFQVRPRTAAVTFSSGLATSLPAITTVLCTLDDSK